MSNLTVTLGTLAFLSVVALYVEFRHKINDLEHRVHKLEERSPKRLPYKSADEIENATAALLKVMFETDFRKDLLENALAHLQKARTPDK